MSAIFGLIDLAGNSVDPRIFETCISQISHYGPDGAGQLIEDNFGFGLQVMQVSTSPLEVGPVAQDDRVTLADAIIDNRAELIAKLGKDDSFWADKPDSHLIAAAYAKWGLDFSDHLLGDFAVAIFDRTAQRLTLVRDHLGTRPLYWSRQGDLILFSTDLRAIIACDLVDWQMDETAIARHLMGPGRPPKKTFFKGVHSVPPGSSISIDKDRTSETLWWSPHNVPAVRYSSREEYVENFRAVLEDVAADYTRTNRPVGAHLSGGIDSSTVAAFGARALQKTGRNLSAAYTWAPPVGQEFPFLSKRDERHNVLAISEKFGFPIRFGKASGEIHRDYLAMNSELDGLADLSDEISVLKSAQSDGVRVMLSGWGGDEAFSAHGIGYLAHTLKRLNWAESYRVLKYHAGVKRFRPRRMAKTLLQWGIGPMLPDGAYLKLNPYINLYAGGAYLSDNLLKLQPDVARWNGEDIRMISDPMKYLANLLSMGLFEHAHGNLGVLVRPAWFSVPVSAP